MLDLFAIFSKSGIVLFATVNSSVPNLSTYINRIIRNVILEDRVDKFQVDTLLLQYCLDNEFELVFVVGYQKMLSLSYIDKFLDDVQLAFRDKYKDFDLRQLLQTYAKSGPKGHSSVKSYGDQNKAQPNGLFVDENLQPIKFNIVDFVNEFGKIYSLCNRIHQQVGARPQVAEMRSFDQSQKSKKTISSMIIQTTNTKLISANKSEAANKAEAANTAAAAAAEEKGGIAKPEDVFKKLAAKGAVKGSPKVKKPAKPVDPKKKSKKPTVWEFGGKKSAGDLDFSKKGENGEDGGGGASMEGSSSVVRNALHGNLSAKDIDMQPDLDFETSDDDEDEEDGEGEEQEEVVQQQQQQTSGKKGFFGSIVSSFAYNKPLSKADLEPILSTLRDHLIAKNVAVEIATRLCDSVATKLEGQHVNTWTGLKGFVRNALEESILRILSPNRNLNILREVQVKNDAGSPYVIVFCGVNALAIVKLLSHVRINEQLFNANVTSIFLRLCQFLQSRATSIREASRSTLVQVMQTLGPKYFGEIFYEMRSLLTRGYQKHIFIFTVYALLNSLRDQLKYGDLDRVLGDVISLCHQEMFGALAEEKEVTHITTKTKEAKKLKSYDIYEILAQFVSQAALTGLLTPLKEVLTSTGSHTVVKKTETAFEKICRGLVGNRSLTVQSLVPVLLQIMATTEAAVVGASTAADASASAADESGKIQRLAEKLPSKVDSYLIPAKSLRRVHQTARLNRSSNLHVMADFALTTVLHLIKQNRLVTVEESHREMLEPMVDQLATFLHSKDTKVITSSMKVLHSLLVKFPDLQSFRATTQTIISQIFVLLRKYSGLAANEGSQLVTLCFKTIAHFVNNRADCKLNDDELAVLLSYAESDIESNSQNATIYLLLKAIIRRKFASKELHRLMERLLVLAITTEIDHVRSHAVELTIKYLTEYPIDGNRFKGKMVKLVRQLEFSNLSGRLAAITILKSVIGMLDAKALSPLKVTLFVPIASRIVNEESTECKRLISATVLTILGKLELADRDNLFETFIEPWLTCDDILVRTLASHLVTQLVKHEKHYFEKRLSACLPLVCQQLDPSRYSGSLGQKATEGGEEVEEVDGTVSAELRNEDNLIFHHLTFVLHLLQLKPFTSSDSGVHFSIVEVLTKAKYYEDFNLIFEYIASTYLLHPHSWIRCLATQIFGQLFSLWSDPQSFIDDVHLYKNAYLFVNTEEVLFNLGKKFCLIFRDIYNCSTVSEQLMKNLVYIARVLIELDGSHEEEEDASERKVSLRWLINKLLFEVKFEVKSSPENYQKRSLLAKWIAAVVFALYGEEKRRKDRVVKYLPSLLPPLCREDLSTSNEGETADASVKKAKEELASLHRQVHEMLKSRLGAQLYHDYYNQVRNEITHRKLERKKSRAIQMITQNDAGVKRKQRKHKRDRVALSAKRRRLVR